MYMYKEGITFYGDEVNKIQDVIGMLKRLRDRIEQQGGNYVYNGHEESISLGSIYNTVETLSELVR